MEFAVNLLKMLMTPTSKAGGSLFFHSVAQKVDTYSKVPILVVKYKLTKVRRSVNAENYK